MTKRSSAAGFGVVEGFYGRPWTPAARGRVLEEASAAGLDTYLWAPKDDSTHRSRWAAPLDRDSLAEIAALSERARALAIDLVHGISPVGATRRVSRWLPRYGVDDGLREALRRRVRDVAAAGVTRFAVLFDDTLPTFVPQTASRSLGQAHAEVARVVLGAAPGAGALIVPAVYYRRAHDLGGGGLAYLRGIASVVGREVPVAWTGPRIFAPWIAGRDIEELERATGLSIFVWSNAVANDWLPIITGALGVSRRVERLSSGPVMNLAPDVRERAAGVLLNGAREPEVTRVAIRTFAEWVRDPGSFEPIASWSRAVELVFGEAAPPVRELLDRVRGHPLCAPHARDWRVRELAQAAQRGDDGARRALAAEAERMATLEARLAEALEGHPAWPELQPTAAAVRDGAIRLRAALAGGALAGPPRGGRWITDLEGSIALLGRRR